MPFYLDGLTGGLGNQVFSVLTAYSLARKYNTTYTINDSQEQIQLAGFKCPNYLRSVMNPFLELTSMSNFASYYTLYCRQFTDITIPSDIDVQNTMILLQGLPMKYSLFSDYLEEIKDIFYIQKNKITSAEKSDKIKVGIMFRTFSEENGSHWCVYDEYYQKSLELILKKHEDKINNLEFHIYSDKAGVFETIILPILNSKNLNIPYFENVGKRDQVTDVKHFFEMFDLDDYILCNSTFHYWAALLSRYNEDKIVIYPSSQKDGHNMWFSHLAHPSWICV
jgi:hypothetical protein